MPIVATGRVLVGNARWRLAQDPLSISAHYLLAQICEHQSQLEAALAAYRRAVYLDQHFIAGLLGMVKVWQRIGHLASAQRCYRNALTQLSTLPPPPIPETDGATAGQLLTLVKSQITALTTVGVYGLPQSNIRDVMLL